MNEVAWYVIKEKRWCNETAVLPNLNKYSWILFFYKNISPILETLCAIIRPPPFFRWWIWKKMFVLYSSKYGNMSEFALRDHVKILQKSIKILPSFIYMMCLVTENITYNRDNDNC
jgi:hypothetical protein